MGKIKGWRKLNINEGEIIPTINIKTVHTWINNDFGVVSIWWSSNKWRLSVRPIDNIGANPRLFKVFSTKKQAITFATNFMKKNIIYKTKTQPKSVTNPKYTFNIFTKSPTENSVKGWYVISDSNNKTIYESDSVHKKNEDALYTYLEREAKRKIKGM